jgi:hypothetical protein
MRVLEEKKTEKKERDTTNLMQPTSAGYSKKKKDTSSSMQPTQGGYEE